MQSKVDPEVLRENKMTINQFLRESYTKANQRWQHGVSFFKHEFFALRRSTRKQFNRMLLPVNNFLKDGSRIESELQVELNKEPKQHIVLEGRMVPVGDVLEGPLEENY
jgi:hypothetical protein